MSCDVFHFVAFRPPEVEQAPMSTRFVSLFASPVCRGGRATRRRKVTRSVSTREFFALRFRRGGLGLGLRGSPV